MWRGSMWIGVLGVAALLAGCGGKSGSGDEKAKADYSSPKAAFETACKAAKDGDLDAFLACLTEQSQTRLKKVSELGKDLGKVAPSDGVKLSAEDMMKAIAKDEATLGETVIEGDKAKAGITRKNGDSTDDAVTFVKVDDEWKLVVPITDGDIQAMEVELARAKKMLESKSDVVEK